MKAGSLARILAGGVCLLLLAPAVTRAQQIGGTVTDTTGAVLPGVTVEAGSPALIEGVRTTVSDGSGRYLIVALEPGVYTVTYALLGFSTLIRDGIQLTTGFTATLDVKLSVGGVDETVTVSGQSPVVDLQNVQQRAIMDRQVIDTIPTGKSYQSYALLVPGMVTSNPTGSTLSQDSGGLVVQGYQTLGIHGGAQGDTHTTVNGMSVSGSSTLGFTIGFVADGNYEEMSIEYSAHSAESPTGGVNVNAVPREGGNTFRGAFFGTFTAPALLADNLDQDLRNRGARSAVQFDQVWLANPSVGGAIVRDRLWFFAGYTAQRANLLPVNTYKNVNPAGFGYVPDLSRPALEENQQQNTSLHLTWQATSKDKLKLLYSYDRVDKPHALQGDVLQSIFIAPEAALNIKTRFHLSQWTWVRPATNRFLLEAGVSLQRPYQGHAATAEAATTLPAILEVTTLTFSRNMQGWLRKTSGFTRNRRDVARAAMTYATGGHNLKVGFSGNFLTQDDKSVSDSNFVDVMTLQGRPLFANFRTHDEIGIAKALELGIFAQDRWTMNRLTVNAGVRFDRIKSYLPDQVRPSSTWAPESFPIEGRTVAIHTDLQPRLGMVYDLFGDGRTALKASASRYGTNYGTQLGEAINPAGTNSAQRRFWVDLNGDQYPQGDPLNPLPNGELFSPIDNPAFGQPVITTFYDDSWAFGWGNRLSNWEFSGSVQQELRTNVSANVGYFRRTFRNFSVADNRALTGADFDQYTIQAPADSRLPGGGGYPITLVDIKPTAFGRLPDVATTHAEPLGGESRTWDGVDVTLTARRNRFMLQGGMSTGKTSTDYCGLASQVPEMLPSRAGNANTVPLDFCQTGTVWLTQVKLLGSYTLPYDIQLAGTYQSAPGPERSAFVTFTAAQVAAALGRPLAGGGGVTVNVLEPATVYGERFQQVDLRLTKIFRAGDRTRIRAMFDLFNVFNANAVTREQYTLGPNYLKPVGIMPGRLAKFAVQLDF